jgi:hypothetical protein
MTEHAQIRLPGGLWLDGVCHREVSLRPLTGRDEELLNESAGAPPAVQVTRLLASCVERVGAVNEITPEVAARLTVGDREALLLHLRRLTLGTRLQCLARCADCGEDVDLDLSVDDLLVPPYADWKPVYEAGCATASGPVRVRYRLPTGADQAAVAPTALQDIESAAAVLLRRCVVDLRVEDGTALALEGAGQELIEQLPTHMAAHDLQSETILDFLCPACGHSGQVLLDAADYLFRELGVRQGDLYRQVHVLALHYHWSESEILALTWRRRQRYLDLIGGAA